MNEIKTSKGSFYLSDNELARLKAAKTAREADSVFAGCKDDIPPSVRLEVWQAV